jgi:hypothetical protein
MCSEYKHTVLPSHIDTYLKDERKHKAVKADREHIILEIQAIRGLKTKRVELNHLVFPPASNPPHPYITGTQERRVVILVARLV